MQCKARRRPCSFSDVNSPSDSEAGDDGNDGVAGTHDIPCNGQQNTRTKTGEQNSNETEEFERRQTKDILDFLCEMPAPEDSFHEWTVDDQVLRKRKIFIEPSIPPIHVEMPSQKVQQHLISLYFKHCYALFPVIPKRVFLDHFERKTDLVTPLLLLSMYAHAAYFSDSENKETYFERAKSILDGYLDTARISTVVALCLLSVYELEHAAKTSITRSSAYGAMALRMCTDITDMPIDQNKEDIELRKRVYWGCYCLDKIKSACTEQPCLLRSTDHDPDMPLLQPGDDATENEILGGFVAYIKLMMICERVLQQAKPIVRTEQYEQTLLAFDNELLHWLHGLPNHLHWTPLSRPGQSVSCEPPANAMVAHLHLAYNVVQLQVLHTSTVTPSSKVILERSTVVASHITELVCLLTRQTKFSIEHFLTASALKSAIQVHLLNVARGENRRAAHSLFLRSIQALRHLVDDRDIPEVASFVTGLKQAIADKPSSPPSFSEDDFHYATTYGLVTPPSTGTVKTGSLSPPSMTSGPATHAPQTSQSTPAYATSCNMTPLWRQPMPTDRMLMQYRYPYPLDFLSPMENDWPRHGDISTMDTFLYRARKMFTEQQQDDPSKINHAAYVSSSKPSDAPSSTHGTVSDDRPAWPTQLSSSTDDNLLYSIFSDHQPQSSLEHQDPPPASSSPPSIHHNYHTNVLSSQTKAVSSSSDISSSSSSSQAYISASQASASEPLHFIQPYQPYMNIGLGVYASAHQHHTDVIRQHFPLVESKTNPAVRPVILTHQGQVIVTGADSDPMPHKSKDITSTDEH
ncbi:fungal-specific transcription factor domain-containing protein [Radiomyces spectabilis]|uniref:fungal-specific transcription factor domain-containing protein n=1 Tax=Radiomyces spectabilis TaxID=64574 RepID=UPI00221EB0C8|nr:fungal-specific transcription factor domain-containing protein [Radiomyces spectabilis]KAI8377410.1 fungal-specific transcription factor domain-containing protein [Radiomyces spectabilis]